jgi:non-ribosomal peptide synthetase component F
LSAALLKTSSEEGFSALQDYLSVDLSNSVSTLQACYLKRLAGIPHFPKLLMQLFSFVDIMDQQERFYSMSNLSDDEQKSLFRFGSGPKINIPHSTIHEAFESIVDNHPEVVAAVHGGKKITYHQLDLATNRLAHHLISSGLRPRERVCLVVQRSLEMLIALMAILKAGCQYVPIDGGVASDEALRHIFEDTGARFVLCLPRYWDRVRQFVSQHVVVLELGMETGAFYPPHRPAIEVSPEDGVYAMYTSGASSIGTFNNIHLIKSLFRKYWRSQGRRRQTYHHDECSFVGTREVRNDDRLKGRTSPEHLFRHGYVFPKRHYNLVAKVI